MGQIRFFAPSHDRLPRDSLDRAYLAGMEGIPWLSANSWEHDEDSSQVTFVVERGVEESGNLFIPWYVDGYGELMLATASLRETDVAYNLPLELARGILNRVRNQIAEWQTVGLVVPDDLAKRVETASGAFIDAVIAAPDAEKTAEAADRAIQFGLETSDALCEEYTKQTLAGRHQDNERLATLLGIGLGNQMPPESEQQLCASAFNTAAISFTWRAAEQTAGKYEWDVSDEQLAWSEQHGLRVIGGPLLQLDETRLPDWIYLWEDDFEQVQSYLSQYIRSTIDRYRGRVHVWNCAARMNVTGSISLTEEQRLRLIVGAVDEVRRHDPATPVILSFDQPWAEYLATNERDLSPLHLADSLVRADLGILGIGIELNIGYRRGTFPRELLEYSRQLDRWSVLGLPLIVFLSVPSGGDDDSQARRPVAPMRREMSPRTQAAFIEQLLPMILAKQYVQGVIWNELTDATSHEFAHGGIVDAQGVAKPVADSLISLRNQHLS
jgi:hypothetical protein